MWIEIEEVGRGRDYVGGNRREIRGIIRTRRPPHPKLGEIYSCPE